MQKQRLKQTYTPIYIYLHTHWDREWFLTFSTSRALLMDRVRRTLCAVEAGELPNFYLDGQAVVLEDLIEIEPQFGERIKKAMSKGRLSAGPWYVLPDQSLVGGESLIRNLKLGIEITKRFGEPTMTGYNPDTFCHVQDLPRILKGFNISTALVLRGVPPLGGTNVFWWKSPDGSKVLTYWLNKGLTHPVFHKATDAKEIAKDLEGRWDLQVPDGNQAPMLYPAGGEGMQPPGEIVAKVQELNAILPQSCQAKVVSMEDFLVDWEKWAQGKTLPEIEGDLRDNSSISERFPAYVLDGVSSTRLYLKRDNAFTEHRLIRIAEPLFTLLHATGIMPYPESELTYVWKVLIQNHPHDSICGCSVDPVHQEMRTRTQQINSFLDGLDFVAMEKLNEWKTAKTSGPMNGKGARPSAPVLPVVAAEEPIDPDNGNDRLLIYNTSTYGQNAPVYMTWYCHPSATVDLSSQNIQIESNVLESHHLFHSPGGFYYKPIRRISGWIFPGAEVPAMGLSEIAWTGLSDKSSHTAPKFSSDKASTSGDALVVPGKDGREIDNGLIRVRVDSKGDVVATSSLFAQTKEWNLGHHFFDVGDGGDSYNFDSLANDNGIKAKLVEVKAGKSGPLVASLILTYKMTIPCGLDADLVDLEKLEKKRAKDLVEHTIQTEISLRKAVPILFFSTTFDNRARDHRLSVRFNLGEPVKESFSECHFSTAMRPQVAKLPQLPVAVGHEIPPQSYFCQRFFAAADQAFLNRGLPEYRMLDDSVEITLLRAVSFLSRGRLRTRGGGAGPWYPTPEANCIGVNHCDYAWAPLPKLKADKSNNEQIIESYRLADLYEGRLLPFAVGKFKSARHQSFIEITNPALYLAATFVDRGKLHLRILNVIPAPQKAGLKISLPVRLPGKVNLAGEDFEALSAKKDTSGCTTVQLSMSANELITIVLAL
jgi:hypothetical protein